MPEFHASLNAALARNSGPSGEPHSLTMEVQDEPRMFRAVCSCGFTGPWKTTNAAMGSGHRHRAQVRRRAAARDAAAHQGGA